MIVVELAIWAGIATVLSGLALFSARMLSRNRQLERLVDDVNGKLEQLQTQFGRFAPEDVIEHLTERDGLYAPRRCVVAVLFADLRNFTRMCERMDPDQVVLILNGYFKSMSEVITQHHGRVTELVGDGMLALFGALENNPWKAQDAVLGALAMRRELARYNQQLRARSLPELSIGIGIHQGEVLAGVIGNDELSKFGVVGDSINLASRVEQLTKVHQVELLITEEVRAELDGRFRPRPMPPMEVKGKAQPIITYTVDEVERA